MDCDIKIYLSAATEMAIGAGKIAKEAFKRPNMGVEYKNTAATDLVTITDRQVEEYIKSIIREKFPNHAFIGEESHFERHSNGTVRIGDGWTWVIDPIDGTTNFVHGLESFFAVSIGLCWNAEPVVGVVYLPMTGEIFSAALGLGATLNGSPINVSSEVRQLSQCLLACEFNSDILAAWDTCKQLHLLVSKGCVRGLRMFGSSAINLCWTACGRVDGFLQRGNKAWDICAGVVILREAGGYITDYRGNDPLNIAVGECIATCHRPIADEIISLLSSSQLDKE